MGAEDVSLCEPIADDKLALLSKFYEDAGLKAEELVRTDGFKAMTMSNILWHVRHGNPIPMEQPHPFNLTEDETLVMGFGSTIYLQDARTAHFAGGYSGGSIRLAPGLYWHFGGFQGRRVSDFSLQVSDYGHMLVTNRHLYFGGPHFTFRMPYNDILRLNPYSDGVGLFRDRSNARLEVFRIYSGEGIETWSGFGWFLFNVLHFLLTPKGEGFTIPSRCKLPDSRSKAMY